MVTFTARRSKPELVAPRQATPVGYKPLSDLDDQWELRHYQTIVEFFRVELSQGGHKPDDPAQAIKAALAEALVYYYPVAGRLRETSGGKLAVECTGDGVVFAEADADVRLEEFGQPLVPSYPCVEELLCDAGVTGDVVGKPLLFMQVTRLKCGGFVMGLRMCRNIVDDMGAIQFMKAIADLAGGEARPAVLPVWERETLTAPDTLPRITYMYPAHEPFLDASDIASGDVMLSTPPENLVTRYLLFGPGEIAALRSHVPAHLRQTTTLLEALTAMLWRCRTVALGYEPGEQVRLRFALDARRRRGGKCIALGYYGNAVFYRTVEAGVDELCRGPLSHALGLVRGAARFEASDDGVQSMLRTMATLRGKPALTMGKVFIVSDVRHVGEDELRFGEWGKRAGGGIAVDGGDEAGTRSVSHCMRCGDSVVVSMRLPRVAMDRFVKEMDVWLHKSSHGKTSFTPSCL